MLLCLSHGLGGLTVRVFSLQDLVGFLLIFGLERRHPRVIFFLSDDADRDRHARVLLAAKHRTLTVEQAGLRGLEPYRCGAAWNGLHLHAEGRHGP